MFSIFRVLGDATEAQQITDSVPSIFGRSQLVLFRNIDTGILTPT